MYFDALTMAAVVEELEAQALGGRVQEVLLVDELTLGLEVYTPPRRQYVVMSAHPQWARVHVTTEKLRRGVETPSPLLLLMRKYVREARLTSVRQVPHERILKLGLAHPEHGETTFVVEVMGRHSNLVLLDADDIILECIKRIGSDINRYRTVLPRQPYLPPPPQEKLPPEELTELRLRDLIVTSPEGESPLWRALVAGIRAVSPLLARELVFRAYGQADLALQDVKLVGPLLEQFRLVVWPETRGAWEPCVALKQSEVTAFAPYALRHLGQYELVPGIGQAVERYFKAQTSRDPYAVAKERVRAILEGVRKQLERKRRALERSLQPATQIGALRTAGEVLLAYGAQVQPGQTLLRAEWTHGEPPVEVSLDPTLTPAENAQKYFDRYHRVRKATQGVPPLLEETAVSEQFLRQLLTDLDLASNQPEIEDIRLALEEAGYVKTTRRRSKAGRAKPLAVQSAEGFTIWVGKNSRQNEVVTFKLAASSDLWFHARGVPGSHVVVRSAGKSVSQTTRLQAAQLAAYYSAARGDSHVAVDCTERRHVRRIKGAAPGLVTYSHETTLQVVPREE